MKKVINLEEYKENKNKKKKENSSSYETIYSYDKKQNELEFV